jgi:hypothetical protein
LTPATLLAGGAFYAIFIVLIFMDKI